MPPLTRRQTLAAAAALPAASLLPAAPAEARPAFAPPQGARPLFGAEMWRLPNGLTVVHVEQRRAPVGAPYLFIPAGGAEDPPGRSGLAHYLEHMMFKGSARVASGEFSRRVAREGGRDNAFTSRDVTAYHQTVEASRLPMIAMMEADRLASPAFPADEFEAERSVVLEERRQMVESNPRSRFREAFDAAVFGPQHWKGRPLIGWEAEIRAISRDDMVAFHRTHYATDGAVLVIAGAVSRAEVEAVLSDTYAAIPARSAPPRARGPVPAAPLVERFVRHDRALREPSFSRIWVSPSLVSGETHHAVPLAVAAHILGGGQGSRLHRALVESGLAVSAGASAWTDTVGPGLFGISVAPRPGASLAAVERAVSDEVARLLDQGVTEAEVARATRHLTAGAMLSLDSIGAAPRMIGQALAIGLPLERVEFWPALVRAVTAEQASAAARAVLAPGRFTATGWHLPEGAEAPA
jgi:zinc protease